MKPGFRNYSGDRVFFFRKWGRKSYSLYSVLNKIVHISVLMVTYLISVPVMADAGIRDSTEVKMQYDLDEVEVTAARAPVMYSQVARVLTLIDASEIERMPVENVQDLLEYVAGIDIRQRGAEGVQADISIRGGTFDQILILLNGINITDPQTGHHNLNLPVSLAQVERIEILEGPAARVYGPNAFSGAINIVTRKVENKHISALLTAGSFGYLNSGLSGSIPTGKMYHMLAANRKSSEGYVENTDFTSSDVYYSGNFKSGAGTLFVQGGMAEKKFGANSFYTPVYPNQFEKVKTYFGSARFSNLSKVNFTPSVYWRRHHDTFMLFRSNAPGWYNHHNYHRTDIWGADLNSWFIWKGGKTSFGAGFRSEEIISNVLGEPMREVIEFSDSEVFYTHSAVRRTVSAFAEHAVFFNDWTITAGLMGNHISDNKSGPGFFPGIDVSYVFKKPFKFIASWNTSLRMPTFTDLYYSGPTNVGNPDLTPEKATTLEGGVKWNGNILKGHVVIFHRTGTDLIDWIRTEDESIWKSMNHTRIKSQGAELNMVYFPHLHFDRLPHKVEFSYLFNQQQKNDSPFLSYYIMDNLRHKIVASVNQQLQKKVFLDVIAVFQDREGTYTRYSEGNFTEESEYKPFLTVDAKASLYLGPVNFMFSVNNIFNRSYFDIGNVVQPERWIKAGVSYNFEINNDKGRNKNLQK